MSPPRTRRPKPRARRATVYVLVLATAAMATAAGVGGIYVHRSRLRSALTAADVERARVLASSGLELALARIEADPDWRINRGSGTWASAIPIGPGRLTVDVIDPVDGAITSSPTDPIVITSSAAVGHARQTLSAQIDMAAVPHSVLACAAYGRSSVYFDASTVTADGVIASGSGMSALLAWIHAPVEAAGSIGGLTYFQQMRSNQPPRIAPGPSVVSIWSSRGAPIPYGSIPSATLQRMLIAPGVSIHGSAASAQGVYVVDCAGGPLTIRDLRIYGTLVVLNTSGVTVTGSVRIDPATAGHPSLIVQGQLRLQLSTSSLSESTINLNLNPAGAPFQGTTNNHKNDNYASGISGIVLATDDIRVDSTLTMTGCLISLDDLLFRATTNLTPDPGLTATPTPGFFTTVPSLSATGVRRITY